MKYAIESIEIPYSDSNGQRLHLKVTRPKKPGRYPAMLDFHGGGWSHFDHHVDFYWCDALAERGFVMISVEFRLAPTHPWPAFFLDAQAALRYVTFHAQALFVNPGMIGTIGGSTGGWLAIRLAMSPTTTEFGVTPAMNTPDTLETAIQWVVGFYPIVDIAGRYQQITDATFSAINRRLTSRLRQRKQKAPSTKLSSPLNLLRKLANAKRIPLFGEFATRLFSEGLFAFSRLEFARALVYPELKEAHQGAFRTETDTQMACTTATARTHRFEHLPPLLIVQGHDDINIADTLTEGFANAYRNAGGHCQLEFHQRFPHGYASIPSPQADLAIDHAEQFARLYQARSSPAF